jgi:hypothetical protein
VRDRTAGWGCSAIAVLERCYTGVVHL